MFWGNMFFGSKANEFAFDRGDVGVFDVLRRYIEKRENKLPEKVVTIQINYKI
jgi:hypothetical protein